jgi:RHS repeat-associated protein
MTKIPQPSNWSANYDLIYDAWNRLVQVKQGVTMIASYEYDGYGRRIAKTSGGVTEDYYYNTGYQIIEVRRGGTMREQLVWNVDYIDSLAVRFNDFHNGTGGAADGDFLDTNEHHYAMQDGNYNVTALADTAGAVFERYLYFAYGNRTVLDSGFTLDADNVSDVGNPYTYIGRQFDPESGLYYYRARFYHSQLGRFCGRDPVEFEGSRWNLYAYVNGSAPNALDPYGEQEYFDRRLSHLSDEGYFDDARPEPEPNVPVANNTNSVDFDDTNCGNAEPKSDTSNCSVHDGYAIYRANAGCICRCAGDSPWDNQVRGCLECAQIAGVDPHEAHERCYELADLAHGAWDGFWARADIACRCLSYCRRGTMTLNGEFQTDPETLDPDAAMEQLIRRLKEQ